MVFRHVILLENQHMKFRLISAILRSAWAIDERYAIAHGGIVAGLLNGMDLQASKEDAEIPENILPYCIEASSPSRKYSSFDEAPRGSIAVIPIRGPLLKDDQDDCGVLNYGMDTLGKMVVDAGKHPNIDGTILYVDCPGGTVDGTQAFADKIKNSEVPIITFVDGLMASGGLWAGTSSKKVIAQNTTTEIGSIGVMIAFADMQPMWEKEGVVFHRINADQSKDKNKTYTDALKGDYKAIKTESLNPIADIFIETVKANRPNVAESTLTGKVFMAKDALALGLIDEIGSFDRAVEVLSEMIAANPSKKSKSNLKQNNKTKNNMEVPVLIDLLQVSAIESTEDGIYLSEAEVSTIEATLAANRETIAGIDARIAAAVETATSETEAARIAAVDALAVAQTELTVTTEARDQELAARETAEANLTSATASLDEIHPEIAEAETVTAKVEAVRTILARKPGVKPAGVKSENDTNPSADGVDWEKMNSLPHMQEEK